jgi:hypothetical protein
VISEEEIRSSLAAELERRSLEEPLRYFKLNEACKRYAESWCDPSKDMTIFLAANSVGKTWSTIALLGWTIWPDLIPTDPSCNLPLNFKEKLLIKLKSTDKSFRICSTPEEAGSAGTLQKAISLFWPKGRYKSEKNRKAFESVFEFKDWGTSDVMTYDQEAKQFEGATRGIIIYNEPPPRPVRQACVLRTRKGGFEVFPGTMLQDAAWIKDELVDRASYDKTIGVVSGDIEEACKDHGKNGHLEHSRILKLMKEMDPDELQARAHGKFMHLSGLIFKQFSREKFMSKIPLKADPLGFPFQVIDPGGYNKPYAIIWGQVVNNPKSGIQILREWPNGSLGIHSYFENMKEPNMTDKDYCDLFAEVENEIGFEKGRVHRILDKRFGHVQDSTEGKSLRDRFSDREYYFNDSYKVSEKNPELKTGVEAIKNYLKICPASKLPYFVLDPSCINVARSFERWALDPKTQKPNDDVWKNFMDTVRYACAADLVCTISEAWNDNEQLPSWG